VDWLHLTRVGVQSDLEWGEPLGPQVERQRAQGHLEGMEGVQWVRRAGGLRQVWAPPWWNQGP